MSINQAKAHSTRYGAQGFEQLKQGWVGSGWNSQFNRITARTVLVEGEQAREVTYEINQHYDKTSRESYGSIVLSKAQALKLACYLAPQIVPALNQAIELLDDLQGDVNPERGYADESEADIKAVLTLLREIALDYES